ncbi:MAG: MaoC/PaaZ C-terminal domain-containing protein [Proteobacteria bacterium]|jgi:acyl dehydratase|nr:MaoC/PaaZ C-terminal domain-containing protein [Pseudomonadota bacterium]MDA1298984.1 MaoC/PaaZ C-terminal domain-containing protein [Pseudomonadota bacterium]
MLFHEQIPVGYRSVIGTWQLNPDDVIAFARAWDPQPFHVDADAAAESVFGELVASSLHIFAICTRLFFDHEDQIAVMAMLGKDKIRLHQPARAWDQLIYRTECIANTPSATRPDRGVIVLADEVVRDSGETVMTQEVTLMVRRSAPLT